MVKDQIARIGVTDERVLDSFRHVHRHRFLSPGLWSMAYEDRAVRRPDGETLTAPDLTGVMLQSLALTEGARVLECGTRSGWLTALLAHMVGTKGLVCTIDARAPSTERARKMVRDELGFRNVRFLTADPVRGYPEEILFDAVVVNGVVEHIPVNLYLSLRPGGRIVAPVGRPGEPQSLILAIRGDGEPRATRPILTVRFGRLAGGD
jgi:protein-L-isoaspartate(D-aspartate) O-methyltransferase